MIPRICRFSSLFAATLLSLAVASPAAAQSEVRAPSFDLFGARTSGGGDSFHTESYGVRGGFRFNNVWALEGSLSRGNGSNSWDVDAAVKAYFLHADRFEMYAVASPGLIKASGENPNLILHAGLGAEIGLTERVYLRPEVRGRWLDQGRNGDDSRVDYSLGLGWRF